MCTVDTNIDNICSKNFDSSTCSDLLLKQDMDVIKVSDKCIPYKTTSKYWFLILKNNHV